MPTQPKKPAEAKDLASVPTPALDSEYERNRLGVLQSYGILDTPRDVGFDEITALAASIFEVPIALISLVDQARQWYKSKVGLDVSETPRAASFCDAAMHGSEVMVVTDATQDPRFMRHPTVTGETAIRFYAGAPLLTAEGYVLGALCLIDRVARGFSEQQRATLRLLAHQVVALLALRKKSDELSGAFATLQSVNRVLEEVQTKSDESEQRLLFALDAAEIGDWNMDLRTNVAIRSLRHDQCFGYTEAVPKWGYDTFLEHVHPADRQRVDAKYSLAMGGQGNYDVEFRVIWPDGTEHWLWSRGRFYLDDLGKPYRVAGIQVDITERKQNEFVSRYNEARYQQLIQENMDAILQTMPDGIILEANPAACALFAMTEDELCKSGCAGVVDPSDPRLAELLQTRSATGHARGELRMRRGDGRLFDAEISSSTFVDILGMNRASILIRDVTERKCLEERLHLAASVFTHAREGIMITDAAGTIVEVNDTFTEITGYSREGAVGQNPRILKSGQQTPAYYAAMWKALADQGHWHGEIWNRSKNGKVYAATQTVSAVRDAAGATQHYVSLFSDITVMKEHQQRLEHIAHYDALTGLPNRVLLADRLRQAMLQSQRRNKALAVVYLDLDGFKQINDRYGHGVGDEMLVLLSQHIKEALREGDTLARIGGDEFVAVLPDLESTSDCQPVLARLLSAAAQTLTIGETALQLSASIGVTIYPQDGSDSDLLLRHADQAMYIAKDAGKNRYHYFDVKTAAALQTQRESLQSIAHALQLSQFVLHYQPKVNMQTGAVVGAEALIRWQHPERGLLAPGLFLPVIENHPLSIAVCEWVIDSALAQMAAWQAESLDLPVSVNIGALQLQQDGFAARLTELLSVHPEVQPNRLQLEVLETSALEDVARVTKAMRTCQALGVGFALDDFGTGYSSLTYLRHLPAETLKIDQSFVRDMLVDPDDLAIVQGVIGLAKSFRRSVIAEGVETAAHGERLLQFGCEMAQGYGIARPMPAADLPAWVQRWQTKPVWTA